MIEGLSLNEMKNIVSPLTELAKQYEQLPISELCKSLDGVCCRLPRTDGNWTGDVGNSKWCPDKNIEPSNRNYSNPENKTWGDILSTYGIDGKPFKDGIADFSEVSKGNVEIENFTDKRYGKGGNFDQADTKLAEQRGCSVDDVRTWRMENNYTWHELVDCKTMQKVPREVHGNVDHIGGVSKYKQSMN